MDQKTLFTFTCKGCTQAHSISLRQALYQFELWGSTEQGQDDCANVVGDLVQKFFDAKDGLNAIHTNHLKQAMLGEIMDDIQTM